MGMLARLLAAPEALVTFGRGKERTVAHLLGDAARVAQLLPDPGSGSSLPDPGSGPRRTGQGRVLHVFESDRYLFLVALLATWSRGYVALLPRTTRRAILSRLYARPDVVSVLHDTESGIPHRLSALLAGASGPGSSRTPARPSAPVAPESGSSADSAAFVDAITTRWSSGRPLVELGREVLLPGVGLPADPEAAAAGAGDEGPVLLSGEDLGAEIARLEPALRWRSSFRVASTVPLGHRYGLVVGVLCPLAWGGAFLRAPSPEPTLLLETLENEWPDALVTHPRELRRLLGESMHRGVEPEGASAARSGRRNGPWVSPGPRGSAQAGSDPIEVVSSTAPLDPSDFESVASAWGLAPLDLFGTTTSGALACRRRPEDPFVCLEGASVAPLGEGGARLMVRGPHAAFEEETTADRVRVEAEGSFTLLGRSDDLLVIDGRPLELRDLERVALALPGVTDAAARRSPFASWPSVLLAVASETASRQAVGDALRPILEGLEGESDRVQLVVVPSLPRDRLGRLPLERLLALFALGPGGEPRAQELALSLLQRDAEGRHRFEVIVPATYRWFDGHFDGYPVLAAAIQLHAIVVPCLRKAGLLVGRPSRFERLKFSRRIEPGARLEVVVWAERGGIRFEIASGGLSFTSGRVLKEGQLA